MKIEIIINPHTLNGAVDGLVALLRDRFSESLASIRITTSAAHATTLARRAREGGVDTMVAVGGDGTVNPLLGCLAGSDGALGIIPTGTANDLSSFLSIPSNPRQACDAIERRHVAPVDVVRVNDWHFATAGGFGLPSEIASLANAIKKRPLGKFLRRWLGSRLYVLASLYAATKYRRPQIPLSIRWNDCSLESRPLALLMCNLPLVGGSFRVSPDALGDDGHLDVCLFEPPRGPKRTLLTVMQVLGGKHTESPLVKMWRARELLISAREPLNFLGDGEVRLQASEFRVRVLPRALKVIVPKRIGGQLC